MHYGPYKSAAKAKEIASKKSKADPASTWFVRQGPASGPAGWYATDETPEVKMPIVVQKPVKLESELLPEGHPEVSCDELAMYEQNKSQQIVTFPETGTVKVEIPYLKETSTCIVGTDCKGVRRWFNKETDKPKVVSVEGAMIVSALLTKERAKQKGFLEVVA